MSIQTANKVDNRKERLKEILRKKSYLHGDFVLSSGEHSNVFFDVKMTSLDPEGAWLAADLMIEKLEKQDFDAVGGLAIGACPIISAICVNSQGRENPIPCFYVRKEQKQHGTKKKIEGFELKKGHRVVIVDDVATKGGSILEAIKSVKELGCEIVKTVVLVDREQGASEKLAAEGYTLESIFKRSDLE